MIIIFGMSIFIILFVAVLMMLGISKQKKTRAAQKELMENEIRIKINKEKKAELLKHYEDALLSESKDRILETGRCYYTFNNENDDDQELAMKILKEMKEKRKYFRQEQIYTDACINGDLEFLKNNLDIEYDINKHCDNDRLTLLCYAIKNNHFEIVKWLVSNKADVNCCIQSPVDYNESESLLVWCIDRQNCDNNEIISYLIDNGAIKKY